MPSVKTLGQGVIWTKRVPGGLAHMKHVDRRRILLFLLWQGSVSGGYLGALALGSSNQQVQQKPAT